MVPLASTCRAKCAVLDGDLCCILLLPVSLSGCHTLQRNSVLEEDNPATNNARDTSLHEAANRGTSQLYESWQTVYIH
jgi:hypothetical protein